MNQIAIQRSATSHPIAGAVPVALGRIGGRVVPEKLLKGLPGKRTARNLVKASFPPPIAWMRTAMRLTLAAAFLMVGYTHVAQIIAVLSAINLVGAVELQISKVALETWRSGIDYVSKNATATRDLPCADCEGTGMLPIPDDCDDDNCCTQCAGRGHVTTSWRQRLLD